MYYTIYCNVLKHIHMYIPNRINNKEKQINILRSMRMEQAENKF